MLVFDPTFGEIYWTVPRFLVKHVMSYESVGAKENFLALEGQGAFSTVWRAVHKTSGQVGESKLQTKIRVAISIFGSN